MWLENVMEKESKGVINPNKREVWGQHKQKGKQKWKTEGGYWLRLNSLINQIHYHWFSSNCNLIWAVSFHLQSEWGIPKFIHYWKQTSAELETGCIQRN